MIHVKKSKIDQEKAKLWGVEERSVFNAPHCKLYNNHVFHEKKAWTRASQNIMKLMEITLNAYTIYLSKNVGAGPAPI